MLALHDGVQRNAVTTTVLHSDWLAAVANAMWPSSSMINRQRRYEKLVDRLLESRHYGEHWGRHWLDLVRYAETNSFRTR